MAILSNDATITPGATLGPVNREIFGGFVEHLGRHIYTGIYEPGHPTATAQGFRQDVIDLVRELGVATIRYPGGNFVSGFRWEDSVGPREQRPRRLDLAWHSTETNEVGLHEFADWLDAVGSELMLAVNLGTRGVLAALDLLEYANIPGGSTLSDQRRTNGREAPFDIRTWCLGNEMDGPWQLGHCSADDYGKIASQTAKAMRQMDPRVRLVACGSSGANMPTFGSWERTVLGHCAEDVDLISCHAYYEPHDGDLQSFLASGVDMANFIETVARIADEVTSERGLDKRIDISFDEWNVWYLSQHEASKESRIDHWPVAPRLLENVYSVLDAVVFGSLLVTLLEHSDRVASASLAQLVNVIGPIMTEPGGPAWRQTTFFPFALTSRLARGEVLRLDVDGPTLSTSRYGDVPAVHGVATRADDATTLFLVNRSLTEAADVSIDVTGFGAGRVVETHLLADDDLDAANTLAAPDRVRPREVDVDIADGRARLTLPPVSWAAVTLAP